MNREERDQLVLSKPCPLCFQGPGEWCVYTTAPKGASHQVGDRTARLHSERHQAARQLIASRRRQEKGEKTAQEVSRLRAQLQSMTAGEIARAALSRGEQAGLDQMARRLREFDREEYLMMLGWLARYGPVLWEVT